MIRDLVLVARIIVLGTRDTVADLVGRAALFGIAVSAFVAAVAAARLGGWVVGVYRPAGRAA